MRGRDIRNILLGIVAGVAGVKASPAIARAARPALRSLMTGALDLSLQARGLAARTKEEFGNIMAEARYEHELNGQMDSDSAATEAAFSPPSDHDAPPSEPTVKAEAPTMKVNPTENAERPQ